MAWWPKPDWGRYRCFTLPQCCRSRLLMEICTGCLVAISEDERARGTAVDGPSPDASIPDESIAKIQGLHFHLLDAVLDERIARG
jgi:hypothetical protein